MARVKEELKRHDIKTVGGFALRSDFVNYGEECKYTPLMAGDTPDEWPEGYIGLPWPTSGIISLAEGESITIKASFGLTVIEGHEAGA